MSRPITAIVATAAIGALGWARGAGADPGPPGPGPGATCGPAALVSGDDELARRVRLELAVLGVRTEEIAAGCPSVRVVVGEVDGGVSVALEDPSGRRARQLVTTPHVAATWIESWVHPELRDPLLAERAAGAVTAAPAPFSAGAIPMVDRAIDRGIDAQPTVPTSALEFRGFLIAAAAEKLYASDDSEWRAISVAGCARWGPLCTGLVAHLADSHELLDDGISGLDRLDAHLLASLAAPFEVGRMRIAPGLGFGLGVLRSSHGSCQDPATGVACDDRSVTYTIGPRAEMGLDAAFPIASRLSLVVTGGLGFAPMAPGDPVPGAEPGPDGSYPGGDSPDGNDDSGEQPDKLAARRGEPSSFTRIGVGLAVELP
jgi:hypothetical protein